MVDWVVGTCKAFRVFDQLAGCGWDACSGRIRFVYLIGSWVI